MVNDVVAEHHVEALIGKRKLLAQGGNRHRGVLPAWKQTAITNGQRIDADSAPRAKIEDQPVCTTTDFNHPRVAGKRSKLFEPLAHALRRMLHREDHFILASL